MHAASSTRMRANSAVESDASPALRAYARAPHRER
jgi:hypothetical protein